MWVAQRVYRIGSGPVGVRSTSEQLLAELDECLPTEFHVEDATRAGAWLSVVVGEETPDGITGLHLLYRSCDLIARSRDLTTLARALLAELAVFAAPDHADRLYLRAAAVRSEQGATALVPPDFAASLAQLGGRVAPTGIILPDAPSLVGIALATGRLAATGELLPVPTDAAERLGGSGSRGSSDDGAGQLAGTSVDAVCWHAPASSPTPPRLWPLTPAATVASLATATLNLPTVGAQTALEALAALVDGARCYGAHPRDPEAVLPTVRDVLRGERAA